MGITWRSEMGEGPAPKTGGITWRSSQAFDDNSATRVDPKPREQLASKRLPEMFNDKDYVNGDPFYRHKKKEEYWDEYLKPLYGDGDHTKERNRFMDTMRSIEQEAILNRQAKAEHEWRLIDSHAKPELSAARLGGALWEGSKDVPRNVWNSIVGLIETDPKNDPNKKPFNPNDASSFIAKMTLPERDAFGQAVSQASRIAGRQLSLPEQWDVWENVRTGRAQPYLNGLDLLNQQVQRNLATNPEFYQSSGFWENVARATPMFAAQIATAVITGAAGSSAFMGLQIAGSTYEQLRAKGVTPERAWTAGLMNAFAQAPLEQIGISKLTGPAMNRLKSTLGRSLAKYGEDALVEGFTEYVQVIPEVASMLWAENPDASAVEIIDMMAQDWEAIHEQGLTEGAVGAFLGGGASVVMHQANRARQYVQNKRMGKLEDAGTRTLKELEKEIAELEADPKANPDDIKALKTSHRELDAIVNKKVYEDTEEAEPETVEQDYEKNTEAYKEALAAEEDAVTEFKKGQEEAAAEDTIIKPAEAPQEEIPQTKGKVFKKAQTPQDEPVAKPTPKEKVQKQAKRQGWRQIKVADIDSMMDDEVDILIGNYKSLDKRTKLDNQRLARAERRKKTLEGMKKESDNFKEAMEGSQKSTLEVYTEEDVNKARKEAGVKEDTPYRIVNVNPNTYLDLTTATDTRKQAVIDKSPDVWDPEKVTEETGAPLLVIDKDGQITAHDGRHRAATAMKAGVQNIPVVVFGNPEAHSLKGQSFGGQTRGKTLRVGLKPAQTVPKGKRDYRPVRYRDSSLMLPVSKNGDGGIFVRGQGADRTHTPSVVKAFKNSMDIYEQLKGANLEAINKMENEIYEGTWRFLPLFDAVLSGFKNVELLVSNEIGKARGMARVFPDKDGNPNAAKIYLNPDQFYIDVFEEDGASGPEVVLIHELLHALHSARAGVRSEKRTAFHKEIAQLWNDIDPDDMEKLRTLGAISWGKWNNDDVGAEIYDSMTMEQRHVADAISSMLRDNEYGKLDPEGAFGHGWGEVPAYILSDPYVSKFFYGIQVKGERESFGKKLIRSLLKLFIPKSQQNINFTEQLLRVHEKYMETWDNNLQSYEGQPVAMESKYSLSIKDFPGFPKGSVSLHAALKASDGAVINSPLGHWALYDAVPEGEIRNVVDGFAALDSDGNVLRFYTREEAARLVDPSNKVVEDGQLTTEDIPWVHHSRGSDITKSPNGDRDAPQATSEQKRRKSRLSEADRQLLERRRAERGGKSLVEVWAEKRKSNQKAIADVKYKLKTKKGVPNDRWKIERATDGLTAMKDATLEKEFIRVNNKLRELADSGYSSENPRVKYYQMRHEAIKLISEKRAMDQIRAQQLRDRTVKAKAGHTKLQNEKFFKAEYKRLIKMDAPYSAVMFARNNLIELMGDRFFKWANEPAPSTAPMAAKATQKPPKVAEKITSEPELKANQYVDPESGNVITRYETPEDAEGKTIRDTTIIAKTAESARRKYDAVITHLKENYLAQNKSVPEETVDGIRNVITQAKEYGTLTDEEYNDAINTLKKAEANFTPDFFSNYEEFSNRAIDPNQAKMDELFPMKVKFDMFLGPDSGYAGVGYQFTIMDDTHPANKGTFTVPELTQAAVDKKVAEINKIWSRSLKNNSVGWTRIENSQYATIEDSDAYEDGSTLRISFRHFAPFEDMEIMNGEDSVTLPAGMPTTEITWEYVDAEGTGTYDRKYQIDDQGNKIYQSDPKKGIAVFRRMSNLLGSLYTGALAAPTPRAFHFSAAIDDLNKQKAYMRQAERIAKHMGPSAKIVTDDNGIYIIDTEYEPTMRDLIRAKGRQVNEDMPEFVTTHAEKENVKAALANWVGENITYSDDYGYADFTFPEGIWIKWSDGGAYDEIQFERDPDMKTMTLSGRHVHYDEIVDLQEIELTGDPAVDSVELELLKKKLDDSIEEYEPVQARDEEPGIPGEDDFIDPDANPYDYFSTDKHTFDDPNLEDKISKRQEGQKKVGFSRKALDWMKLLWKSRNEFPELKRKDYSDVQFLIRKLKAGRDWSAKQATMQLGHIINGLTKTQYHNLERFASIMDFYDSIEANKQKVERGEIEEGDIKYPFDMTEDQVRNEAAKLFNLVRNDPDTWLAWKTRQNAWFRIRTAYNEAMKDVGFDVGARLKRAYYFRHQVLEEMEGIRKFFGSHDSGKLVLPTKRSFLKKRGGTSGKEINMNYIQAEWEVMSQMIYDTQIAKTLHEIMESHGVQEARPGYSLYSPREDSIFYMVNTVPGRIVQKGIEDGLAALKVPVGKIGKAVAMGGKYKGWYLPDAVAATLNDLNSKRPTGWFMKGFSAAQTMWKQYQLLNPVRAFKYNVRNMTGDAEAVFIGNPAVFKQLPSAVAELKAWRGGMGPMSPDLEAWLERGGSASTLQFQEMEAVINEPEFTKVTPSARGKLGKAWDVTYGNVRKATDFREMSLRFAAYKQFLKEMQTNNGRPKRYAASLREEVEALGDIRDRAFMMSNDLLGAYDRISEAGQNLRRYLIPFWSFQEVNATRTWTMLRNVMSDEGTLTGIGRFLGAKGVTLPLRLGMLATKLLFFSTMIQAWNKWMFPDEEDNLPEEMRTRSHIILGRPAKDNMLYFTRIGILGDLLEWGGLDSLPSDIADIHDVIVGKTNLNTLTKKYQPMSKKRMQDIFNKVAQGIGPQFKMPIEAVMGEKFFPDVWNRQPITSHTKWLLENFSLGALYPYISNLEPKPQATAKDMILNQAGKALVYMNDPDRLGWLAMRDKVITYMKDNKLKGSGFIKTEAGNYIYNMGVAWRYGDMDAYRANLLEYVRASADQLKKVDLNELTNNAWDKLHPLSGLNDTHMKLFLMSLDHRGKKQLATALKYYAELRSGKQFFERNK